MTSELTKTLWKVVLPVIIGITVVLWLFRGEFNTSTWNDINFDSQAITGICLAWLFMAGRDFGLSWRFHTIASGDLSWARSVKVDMMCAFTSAITPSAVGGSALAIFYLNREGIALGRATTLTLTTLFLDELFFVVFCPIIVLALPFDQLFGAVDDNMFLQGLELIFWLVYAGIVIWTSILFFGIIVRPAAVQKLLSRIFRWRPLRRWGPAVDNMTANMVTTSAWVKKCSLRWWLNVFGATILSWFSRYLIVNALFWGFVPDVSQFLVFGRQFVVWVVLMVSPTPGGSGISEWMFTEYYGDLIGSAGIALILALMWRIVSYYIYLLIGVFLLPTYFSKKKQSGS